jgi:hypothetical protein
VSERSRGRWRHEWPKGSGRHEWPSAYLSWRFTLFRAVYFVSLTMGRSMLERCARI